jgi:hypothetical protein
MSEAKKLKMHTAEFKAKVAGMVLAFVSDEYLAQRAGIPLNSLASHI